MTGTHAAPATRTRSAPADMAGAPGFADLRLSVWATAQQDARTQRRGRYLPAPPAHPAKMLPAIAAPAITRYPHAADLDAELREALLRLPERERGLDPRLGRDAAHAEAGAAELGLLLDAHCSGPELRGPDRGRVAAGAAAEDDQVEAVGGSDGHAGSAGR